MRLPVAEGLPTARALLEAVVLGRRPFVVMFTDPALPATELRSRDEYAQRLEGQAVVVAHLDLQADGTGLPALEDLFDAGAGRLVAAVADVSAQHLEEALSLVETAWFAGFTTVTRWSPPSPTASPTEDAVLQHECLSYTDVIVAAHDRVIDLEGRSQKTVLSRSANSFDVEEFWAVVGDLNVPTTAMKLSVVIATFERRDELRACLQSLTVQTLPPAAFEVIVVDDASPGRVDDIVQGFTELLDVLLVRLDTNSGPGEARNRGIQVARGDVVLLLDDDDVAAPRMLAEHLRLHEQDPRESLAVLGHTAVRTTGRVDVFTRHVTKIGHQYFGYASMRDGDVLPWHGFWCGRVSAKTSLFRRHPFRRAFLEDTDFAWRVDEEMQLRGKAFRVVYARQAM